MTVSQNDLSTQKRMIWILNMIPNVWSQTWYCMCVWDSDIFQLQKSCRHGCIILCCDTWMTYILVLISKHYISELGGGFIFFLFSPQLGWNYQPENHWSLYKSSKLPLCAFVIGDPEKRLPPAWLQWLARWPATKLFSKWCKGLLLGRTYYL